MTQGSQHEQNTDKIDRRAVWETYRSLFESGAARFHGPDSAVSIVQLPSVLVAYRLPVGRNPDSLRSRFRKKEISYTAIYHHFARWSQDGSLKQVWQQSILTIRSDLNLTALNLDGTHSLAKKGGGLSPTNDARKARPAIFCRLWMRTAMSWRQRALWRAIIMMPMTSNLISKQPSRR